MARTNLLTVRHGVRGSISQAAFFNARQRSRENRDPVSHLSRTHELPTSGTISTSTLFPGSALTDRFTLSMQAISDAAGATGVTIGNAAARYLRLQFNNGDIIVHAGNSLVAAERVTQTYVGLIQNGVLRKATLAVSPGEGKVQLFVDGLVPQDPLFSSGGDFGSGGWSDTTDGAIVEAGSGDVAVLSGYVGQVPRQF